jgi:hypothetical protein
LDRAKKISKICSDAWQRWRFYPRSGTSRTTSRRTSALFINNGPNRLKWDAQLLSYWFSRNPAGGIPTLAVNLIKKSPSG